MLVEGTPLERVLAYDELISAIILAVTTIAMSWCAYQSAVWSGIENFRLAESNRLDRHAVMLHLEANQEALRAAPGSWRVDPQVMREARIATARSTTLLKAAHLANHTADTYLLATVMLASVLFFAGIATKFKHPDIRVFLLILAGLNLVGAGIGVLVRLPTVLD